MGLLLRSKTMERPVSHLCMLTLIFVLKLGRSQDSLTDYLEMSIVWLYNPYYHRLMLQSSIGRQISDETVQMGPRTTKYQSAVTGIIALTANLSYCGVSEYQHK
jgi:hypothetical protein